MPWKRLSNNTKTSWNQHNDNMPKEMTLLEQAKQVPRRKRSRADDEELLDLAIAWLKGEVTSAQAATAAKTSRANIGQMLAAVIYRSCLHAKISITITKL